MPVYEAQPINFKGRLKLRVLARDCKLMVVISFEAEAREVVLLESLFSEVILFS